MTTYNGTLANETLEGSANDDALFGLGGNDSLSGGEGNDYIDGGIGNDVLDGGDGSDLVDYWSAISSVFVDLAGGYATGGYGDDTLTNIEGVYGSRFDDELYGDSGDNLLYGSDGNDLLSGDSGDDFIDGGAGEDRAKYYRSIDEYQIAYDAITDTFVVADKLDDGDGRDEVTDVEVFEFADTVLTANELIANTNQNPQDDFDASILTIGYIFIGKSVAGRVEQAGDEDWFAVKLEAGNTYIFSLAGTDSAGLKDPILALYDSDGILADFNVDTSNTINAEIMISVATPGTYYVSVAAIGVDTGRYLLATAVAPKASGASTYVLAPSVTNVNEGSSVTFVLTTTNVAAGTVLTYALSGTGVTTADTSVPLTGSVTVGADGKASLTLTPTADLTTEGAETVRVSLATGSAQIANSSVTINDTSASAGAAASGGTKAKVFMGTNDTFTVSDSGATLIGNLGSNTVKLASGVTGIKTDANFSRIELAGNLADYKLGVVPGTGLQIQTAAGVAVDTIVSLNTDLTLAFANGSATLKQTGITAFSLGGQSISTTTPATVAATLNTSDTSSFGSATSRFVTKAKVFMGVDDTFTISDSGATLIGNLGSNTAKLASGVTGVKTDANFSRIELGGNLADYKLGVVPGTGLQLQTAAGAVVNTIVSLNTDVTLAFGDGSAALKQTGITAFSLGGLPISTSLAGYLAVTLNTADKSSFGTPGTSSVAVSAAGTTDAATGNVTFNVHPSTTFTYNVAGFAAGDKLVFDAGTSLSISNANGTDGIVDVIGTLAGQAVTIHLTGVAVASDGGIFNASSFNTVFGAGALG